MSVRISAPVRKVEDALTELVVRHLEAEGYDRPEAEAMIESNGDVTFDMGAVLHLLSMMRDDVVQAGSETAPGWGRRLRAMMSPLGIDFGDSEEIERSLRKHYRDLFDNETLKALGHHEDIAAERYETATHGIRLHRHWLDLTPGEKYMECRAVAEEASRYRDMPAHVLYRLGVEGFPSYEDLDAEQRVAVRGYLRAERDTFLEGRRRDA